MLERIRRLIDEVSEGDLSKLEAIDLEFEKLVKDGADNDLEDGIKLMEDFLFSQSQVSFDEGRRAAS